MDLFRFTQPEELSNISLIKIDMVVIKEDGEKGPLLDNIKYDPNLIEIKDMLMMFKEYIV